jgi:predicted dehydrogenase
MKTIRMGFLGAAKITPPAVIRPARDLAEVEVRAVAARDPARGRAFAAKHGIPVVYDNYDAVVQDPDIDAVYVPVPNGLHAKWTLRAIEAGKHVLCEKPFTANAGEASVVADAANRAGVVVMEAFHWRYHPLAARMVSLVQDGTLGAVRRIEATLCFPLFNRSDIRWQPDLAGGALMDIGCYAVNIVRTLAGAEPSVSSAVARLRSPGIDRYMRAELRFPDGSAGGITASMWSNNVLRMSARVTGEKGSLHVINPLAPQYFNLLTVRSSSGTRRERVRGPSTYSCQLRAFAGAVLRGEPILTPPADSVANMTVIDAIYRAAGMEPRRGSLDGPAPAPPAPPA